MLENETDEAMLLFNVFYFASQPILSVSFSVKAENSFKSHEITVLLLLLKRPDSNHVS